jgi:surfactin synthase thioesterase subunit
MPTAHLLCLPHAGAGPSVFHPWRSAAPEGLEICPVSLPGRERRLFEDPYVSVHDAVCGIAAELTPVPGEPLMLFGHCLGALLAYELARCLHMSGTPVAHLLVSGTPGPRHVRKQRITGLPEAEFLERMTEIACYRHEALDDPEMRELMLPALRADVQMHEDYRPSGTEPLPVRLTALRGADDDTVSAAQIGQWKEATSGQFCQAECPGTHMYFLEQGPAVLHLAQACLAEAGARS